MWTFRSCALHLVLSLWALASVLAAQTVQPTAEDGRIIWTNDGPAHPAKASPHVVRATHRVSPPLFYWNEGEQCWKPIRPATPHALRSAQVVAGEVSTYIESRPRLDSNPAHVKEKQAEQDPDYSRVARNHSVTTAEVDRYINDAAARHHVDPNLVRALVKVESNFNPRAVSNKGAMGLMQLMPATARMYDLRHPFDAAENVEAGVRHLKGLLKNFGGDVSLSLAAYNAGQGAVERNGGIPPYTETRNYVKRITSLMGGGSEVRFSSLSIPIQIRRDERGRMVISNTD